MDQLRLEVNESMIVVDGGPDAELPPGSGGPVLAGPEAIFVAGRVEFDAPTVIRVGTADGAGDLVLAYSGALATPQGRLRVVNIDQDVLGEVKAPVGQTTVAVYVSDLDEPDEILVAMS